MLFAPALLALVLQTPAPAAKPAALADLVPKNTVAFVQAPSLDRAAAFADRLAQTFAPGLVPKIDVATMLAAIELHGDAKALDTTRPVGLCVVLSEIEGAEPMPAFLIPVRDADAYLKSLAGGGSGMQGIAKGGYACIGMGAVPELPSSPSPIANGLPEGELAARVDLGRLIEQFRGEIDGMLTEIASETAALSGASGMGMGMDMAPVMAAYAGWVRDVVDSAETLDLALHLEGDELELGMSLSNAEGSALASFGSKEKTGLRTLAPLLDSDSGMSLLTGMDAATLLKRFQPMFDAMPAAYPEALRPAMKELFSHVAEFYGYLGTAQAASMDFGESGFRYRAYSRGGDAFKLLEAYRKLDKLMPGLELSEVPEREVAGVKVRGLHFKLDMQALMKQLASKDVPEEMPPQFDALMEKIFGKDGVSIQVASKDGTSLIVMGGDEAYLAASIARISSKGQPPAFLARALQQVGDLNPCMIVRYDLGRMLGGMKDLVAAMVPGGAGAIPTFALSLTAWGGVDGRVWRGATVLNLREIAALVNLGRRGPTLGLHAKAGVDIELTLQALEQFAINNGGVYPDSLEVLVTPDANGHAYLEGYAGRIPKDPWGNEYHYAQGTKDHPRPRVFSYGSDGVAGGIGDAADIDSDKPEETPR